MIKDGGDSQHHSESQNLLMIKTNIGLMRVYSNSYEDDNNELEWWKDRPKFKFKHKT